MVIFQDCPKIKMVYSVDVKALESYSRFKMISAAITPGTQPQIVSISTTRNEPHP